MRKLLTTVLATVIVFLALPVLAAAPSDDDDTAELPDVAPRCMDDVTEADTGMVDMACDDEPQAESMSASASSLCCSDCTRFASGWTCVFVYHCNTSC